MRRYVLPLVVLLLGLLATFRFTTWVAPRSNYQALDAGTPANPILPRIGWNDEAIQREDATLTELLSAQAGIDYIHERLSYMLHEDAGRARFEELRQLLVVVKADVQMLEKWRASTKDADGKWQRGSLPGPIDEEAVE